MLAKIIYVGTMTKKIRPIMKILQIKRKKENELASLQRE